MLHCVKQCTHVGFYGILLSSLQRVVSYRRKRVHGQTTIVKRKADDVKTARSDAGVRVHGDVQRDCEVGSAVGRAAGDIERLAWELNDAWSCQGLVFKKLPSENGRDATRRCMLVTISN